MTVQYLDLLRKIQDHGTHHGDRTGTGTTRIFGHQMRFDLSKGFPILTTKKLPFRWIAEELIWMLSGSTDEADLQAKGVDIWKEWATAEACARFGRLPGDLGPIYGHQWRRFGATLAYHDSDTRHDVYDDDGTDQIAMIVDMLINNPGSRRIILSGWNPKEATQVALPPCHTLTQFSVSDGKLSAQLYQRSADTFLGVPFNIASYALLVHMLAHVCDLEVGDFIHTFGDVHIYSDHEVQVAEQLCREPKTLPRLEIIPNRPRPFQAEALTALLDLTPSDLALHGYDPDPVIRANVSV